MPEWATVRARDVDREYTMGLLREAAGEGQLSGAEFDLRLRRAMRARTLGELAALVDDLRREQVARVAPVRAERRGRGGRVLALVVLAGMLLVGSRLVFGTSSESSVATEGAVEYASVELSTDPSMVADLKELGLPSDLPIPVGAESIGRNWVSADNGIALDETMYRWHLEYRLEAPATGGHPAALVAELYRSSVVPETFGLELGEDEPEAGVSQLRWGSLDNPSMTGYALMVRVHDDRSGVRVELDVSTSGPTSSRPDVPGALGALLQGQKVEPGPGMKYRSSKVGQAPDDPSTCVIEQLWTPVKGGMDHLFYDTSPDCAALTF